MSSTLVNTFQSTLPSKWESRGTKDLISFRFPPTIYIKTFLILNESQSKFITQNTLIFTKCLTFCILNGTTHRTIIPDHPHCVKSVQIRSFFWFVFSCIYSKYRKVHTGKISVYGHFSGSALLTHFSPVSHFYTPWKRQQNKGFLTFSGGMELWHWTKMG